MYTPKFLSISLMTFTSLTAAQASSSTAQVWLLNCIDKVGARYSELALYPDFPNGYPISTALLPTLYNTTVAWQFANITKQLPGGNIFETTEFGSSPPEEKGGLVKLGDTDLSCRPYAIEGLYTTTDKSVCSSVFQCKPDHVVEEAIKAVDFASPQKILPAAAAFSSDSDTTKIIFQAYGEKVIVSGKLVTGDIFWNVWDERDAFFFSGKERGFGTDGCTVRYEGHGDIEWATTNGLANTLLTMASASSFLEYTSYRQRDCETTCEQPGHPGVSRCCAYQVNTYWQTHIPSRVDFQVVNEPPAGSGRNPNDQGSMSYFITCPAKANIGCTVCKILGDLFGGGALVGGPEEEALAKGFGVANLVTSVACQIAGC